MKYFWLLIYNVLLLPLIYLIALFLSLFNQKIRKGVRGRRESLSKLKEHFSEKASNRLVYWFHSASHGEYEQVRPVIAGLKEIEPDCYCVASFFSPSGYMNVDDPHIDCKVYLPFDFYWNVWRALRLVRPHKFIFAEYDLWPNLVWCAQRLGIKTTLFSARIHSKSAKVWPILRSLYKQVYSSLSTVYTISEKDHLALRKLLTKSNRSIVRVLGNPRYDRVKELADRPTIEKPKSLMQRPLRFIAGSVWPEDDEIILRPVVELMREREDLLIYWVPHEPNSKYLTKAMKVFENSSTHAVLLSGCNNGDYKKRRAVIVDEVGLLSELYWHGRIAYVGGGFSSGIHNVMEPAIARLPIIFGPKFHNSDAAEELLETGGGFSVSTQDEFLIALGKLIEDSGFLMKSSLAATEVIHRNLGSATRVVRGILRD